MYGEAIGSFLGQPDSIIKASSFKKLNLSNDVKFVLKILHVKMFKLFERLS